MRDVEHSYFRFTIDQTIEMLQDIRERLITEDYDDEYDITGLIATVNSFRWEVEAYLQDFSFSGDEEIDDEPDRSTDF